MNKRDFESVRDKINSIKDIESIIFKLKEAGEICGIVIFEDEIKIDFFKQQLADIVTEHYKKLLTEHKEAIINFLKNTKDL